MSEEGGGKRRREERLGPPARLYAPEGELGRCGGRLAVLAARVPQEGEKQDRGARVNCSVCVCVIGVGGEGRE
jgi:hypothetical protein